MITVNIPKEILCSFLDWMDSEGHTQFRRFLREGEEIADEAELLQVVNYDNNAIEITLENYNA